MKLSTKALAENTIGEAVSILNAANAEGRGPSDMEWEKVKMLGNLYGKTTGRYPPMTSGRHFLEWASGPAEGSMSALDVMASNLTNGMGRAPGLPHSSGASSNFLVDAQGRRLPVIAENESFAAAVRREPQGEVDEKFAGFMEDGLTLGGFLKALAIGPQLPVERAAISASDAEGGGYVVPSYMSAEIIDLYRPLSTVLRAGATMFEMQAPEHSFGRETSSPTCAWTTETGDAADSTMTFGKIVFTARNLRCILKFSRNWAEDVVNGQRLLEQALSKSFAQEVDRGCLYGDAVQEPHGLANDADIQTLAINGTLQGYDTILDGVKLLDDQDVPDPTGLIMSTREGRYYDGLKDGDGLYLQRPPRIRDLPSLRSSKVPTDGGVGSNESDMFLGLWSDFYIGTRAELRIELLRELYAAQHQFGLLCYLRMDAGTARPSSFVKMSGIIPS
jgi:HK97 family phage major capsid protein